MKSNLRHTIKKLRGRIKKSDNLFALRRNFVDKDLRRERKRMKVSQTKSSQQIKDEIMAYKSFWKRIPHDYIRYGLFDAKLGIDEILDYIPMQYYYCDFYDNVYSSIYKQANSGNFVHQNFPSAIAALKKLPQKIVKLIGNGKRLDDKLLQYLMLRENGIPIPEVIAVVHNDKIYNLQGHLMSLKELGALIPESSSVFIKPTDGCGGAGIKVVYNSDGLLFSENKHICNTEDLRLDKSQVYIIQLPLHQHQSLNNINDSSVNTLRTIIDYRNGDPTLIGIILRMGRKNSRVDNSAQGGISISVDPNSGKFGTFAGREHGGGKFEMHPDSKFIFAGKGIPNWDIVKTEIIEITNKFSIFPILGWDLAIDNNNRVQAIEFNLGFGIEHAQTILGGLRRKLKIEP